MKPSLYPVPSGSSRLFGAIGMDFMTNLPPSGDGFDSIMVVIDHGLSKGMVLTPTTTLGSYGRTNRSTLFGQRLLSIWACRQHSNR